MRFQAPQALRGPLDLLDLDTPMTGLIVMKTTPELTEDKKERKATRASEDLQELQVQVKELAPASMLILI